MNLKSYLNIAANEYKKAIAGSARHVCVTCATPTGFGYLYRPISVKVGPSGGFCPSGVTASFNLSQRPDCEYVACSGFKTASGIGIATPVYYAPCNAQTPAGFVKIPEWMGKPSDSPIETAPPVGGP